MTDRSVELVRLLCKVEHEAVQREKGVKIDHKDSAASQLIYLIHARIDEAYDKGFSAAKAMEKNG